MFCKQLSFHILKITQDREGGRAKRVQKTSKIGVEDNEDDVTVNGTQKNPMGKNFAILSDKDLQDQNLLWVLVKNTLKLNTIYNLLQSIILLIEI